MVVIPTVVSGSVFDQAWDLIKARLTESDKKDWGKPGQMMFWSKRYGGEMPGAVPYPWRKYTTGPMKGLLGPERPKDQYYGGGNRDIYDFMDLDENRDLLNQLLGSPRDRNITGYPLEGREIVPWSEFMANEGIADIDSMSSATEAVGGYGKPGKLEGISLLDKPAIACKTKTCGACEACYARERNMASNPAQARQYNILDRILTDPVRVASGLDESLFDAARPYAGGKDQPAKTRIFAAGDAKDAGELSMITDVLNNQRPWELAGSSHWLSTRQYPAVHEFLQARNWKDDVFPENLHFKLSLPGQETRDSIPKYTGRHADLIRDILSHPQISATSYLEPGHKGEGIQVCPASEPGNPSECKEVIDPRTGMKGCTSCHSITDIGYRHHGRTKEQTKLSRQALEAAMANMRFQQEPDYKQTVLGRRVT
tara:strand:+ start:5187 stop:6467 length:1281 start_codon:yes stop_codon:yes gene_type:complete